MGRKTTLEAGRAIRVANWWTGVKESLEPSRCALRICCHARACHGPKGVSIGSGRLIEAHRPKVVVQGRLEMIVVAHAA